MKNLRNIKIAFFEKIPPETTKNPSIPDYLREINELTNTEENLNFLKILNTDVSMNFISNGKFIRLYTSAKKWAACTPKDCKNIEFVLNNNKTKELIKNEYINLDDLSMLFAYPKPLEFIVENNPEILEYKAAYANPENFLKTNIEDGDLKKRVYKLAEKNIYYLRNINEIQNKVADNKKILNDIYDKCEAGLSSDLIMPLAVVYNTMNSDLDAITDDDKILIMDYIACVKDAFQEDDLFCQEEISDIKKLENRILSSLGSSMKPKKQNPKDTKIMMQGFFANNNSSLNKLLKNTDFTKYKKEGLPLKYSRDKFISDLDNELEKLNNEEKKNILHKLDISLVKDRYNHKTIGYNGTIKLDKLSNNDKEGKILKLALKFTKENSVETGNEELDSALNSLIQGMPEFLNIVGKKQHRTQNYSLDIHILTVLKEAMSNPEYEELSDLDKTCLKFSVIMHDISKQENVIDDRHPLNSALKAKK